MERTKIAVDIDGTVAATHDAMIPIINEVYRGELEWQNSYPVTLEDISDWNWGPKLRKIGLSFKSLKPIVMRAWENYYDIRPTEQNLSDKLSALSALADFDFVTAGRYLKEIKKWLYVNSADKHKRLLSEFNKEELGYYIYVDDAPHLGERISESQNLLLYDSPFNRCVSNSHNVIRVYDFSDVVRESEKLLNDIEKVNSWKKNFP